jgi:hypothetical protein
MGIAFSEGWRPRSTIAMSAEFRDSTTRRSEQLIFTEQRRVNRRHVEVDRRRIWPAMPQSTRRSQPARRWSSTKARQMRTAMVRSKFATCRSASSLASKRGDSTQPCPNACTTGW